MPFASYTRTAFLIDYGQNISILNDGLVYGYDLSEQYGHTFCGPVHVSNSNCPNCKKPFLQLLSLDTKDPKANLQKVNLDRIDLIFCWTCNIVNHSVMDALRYGINEAFWIRSDLNSIVCLRGTTEEARIMADGCAPFYYELKNDKSISLLQYRKGGCTSDNTYENYPISFPVASVKLIEIKSEVQDTIKDFNSGRVELEIENAVELWNIPRHQVGGEPYLLQQNSDYEMICPLCASVMPFISNIANDCLDPRGIVGDDYVQLIFHFCSECNVVGVFNQAG